MADAETPLQAGTRDGEVRFVVLPSGGRASATWHDPHWRILWSDIHALDISALGIRFEPLDQMGAP